ncbi:hypothetical protein Tco_0925250 [Tanacetum coccineum]|uniref:CCHC-type domain-containing protein n=1 Tax=Tanacetum coccineum TaxID=301880 RepID=A0ABQ5D992_9ASTR
MDAGISLVPLHAVDEGRNDDTQNYDQPAEQLGVFSASIALADVANQRRKQAKPMAEHEQERINFEAALELQRQLDEREEVAAKPAQGGYKMNYFKGMKYEDIRPIFEKVWDQIQSFAPMDSEKEKGSEKKGNRKKTLAKKRINGGSKNYKIFSKMLDDFDRRDVMDLHRLVEERCGRCGAMGHNRTACNVPLPSVQNTEEVLGILSYYCQFYFTTTSSRLILLLNTTKDYSSSINKDKEKEQLKSILLMAILDRISLSLIFQQLDDEDLKQIDME